MNRRDRSRLLKHTLRRIAPCDHALHRLMAVVLHRDPKLLPAAAVGVIDVRVTEN